MGLCMSGGGQFVDRNAVALVDTPERTDSWKPVPHIEVIDAVTEDHYRGTVRTGARRSKTLWRHENQQEF